MQLLEKRPGAVIDSGPTTIYINMIKHIEHYPEQSKMAKMCTLHGKFNDLLNDLAAKKNNRILSIRSLNSQHYFDARGNLSRAGKEAFWWELDNLIQKFESNKVKLLPRVKHRAHHDSYATSHNHHQTRHSQRDRTEWYPQSVNRSATARRVSPEDNVEEYYTNGDSYHQRSVYY